MVDSSLPPVRMLCGSRPAFGVVPRPASEVDNGSTRDHDVSPAEAWLAAGMHASFAPLVTDLPANLHLLSLFVRNGTADPSELVVSWLRCG